MTVQHETDHDTGRIFRRSREYWNTHYAELLEKYPKHYIAVYDGEIVGASLDFHDLFGDLKAKNIPLRNTVVDYLDPEDVKWVFPAGNLGGAAMTVQHEPNPNGMRIFTRSTKYLSTHYHELLENYPKHYIAIFNGEVIAASLSREDLFDDLREKNIPLRNTLVDYMETEDVKWVFPS